MSIPDLDIGRIMIALIGLFLIVYSVYVMKTKKIPFRGGIIDKEQNPRFYWGLIGIWILVGILLLILPLVFGYVYHRW